MSTLPAERRQRPAAHNNLPEILKAASGRIAQACPQHFTPERLIQLASVLIFKTPKLQQCDPESVITAMIQAGSLGADLNPSMMEAFFIPRWNKDAGCLECQFQPGYQLLAKLAINTGTTCKILPREVCENDTFEVWYEDDKTHIRHGVDYKEPRGRETHYYAVATTDTGPVVEVMTFEQTEDARKRSQYPDAGPWRDWPGEMRKKTVVKRICKRLPRSSDPKAAAAFGKLQEAIDLDDREYLSGPEVKAHHAVNHDNATGHGSGAYAPPDVVREYQEWCRGFVDDVNAKWLDRNTGPDGSIRDGIKDLLSTWQVTGHLLKTAVAEGRINAPDDARARQRDKFVAVLWDRERHWLISEAEDYGRRKWTEARQALKTHEPKPQQAEPVPAEDVSQDDPDATYPPEPGSDG